MDVSTFLDLVDRMQAQADKQTSELKVEMQKEKSELKAEMEKEKSALKVEMEAKLEAQRHEMEAKLRAQKHEMEAKLVAQRHEMEAKQQTTAYAKICVSDTQLEALQERFDALHHAKLLTDDEVAHLQDKVADFIGCRSSSIIELGEIGALAETIRKLVGVCEGVSKDRVLARQLQRKFL